MKRFLVKSKSLNLFYAKSAVKDIKKLDSVSKKKIKKKLEYLAENPLKHAKKLVYIFSGFYRWRIGKYRVVFDIKGKKIIVLRIGHRREIYR